MNKPQEDAARTARLTRTLENTLSSFADLSRRPMFGVVAYFIRGNVVAFVSKESQIGLKLTDPDVRNAALDIDGITPFTPSQHSKPMKDWVLVAQDALPESDLEELIERCAQDVGVLPPKPPRQRRNKMN